MKQKYTKLEIQHSIKYAKKEIKEWQKFIKSCESYLKKLK